MAQSPSSSSQGPVPFALGESVKQELHQLEDASITTKVSYCSCTAPIVGVPKRWETEFV